jgi:hypothetical protein
MQTFKKDVLEPHKQNLPLLLPFGDTISKNFQRSPGCSAIQILLLKLWDQEYTLNEMRELIDRMNSFIIKCNEDRKAGIETRGRTRK